MNRNNDYHIFCETDKILENRNGGRAHHLHPYTCVFGVLYSINSRYQRDARGGRERSGSTRILRATMEKAIAQTNPSVCEQRSVV